MQYREFRKIGRDVSLLGVGCMRLPQTADDKIDEAEAIRIIRTAIDKGVNYVDTAYIPLRLGVQTFHVGGDNEACRRRGDSIG